MDTTAVWELGEQGRDQRADSVKARADVVDASVTAVHSLFLHPTPVGVAMAPHLHVDIVGWPDLLEVQRMWVEVQRMGATEVAAAASLHLAVEARWP